MPLTSSVMRQRISNFRLHCCSKKIQMLRKKVKLILEHLQVCIFAEIVFGVRCTLRSLPIHKSFTWLTLLQHIHVVQHICETTLGNFVVSS